MTDNPAFVETLITLADDHLVLGHRLSQWCGHAPMLEEDLSLPNMALDLLGQASTLYSHAANLEAKGRSEDDIAFLRTEREYKNCLIVERPNNDFAHTILRQFYFAAFMQPYWVAAQESTDETMSGLAQKATKEMAYHIRHCGEWIVRLGDGTDESARRMKAAVTAMHPYTNELFTVTEAMKPCIANGLVPDPAQIHTPWKATIDMVFSDAFLTVPDIAHPQEGGRDGRHTEDFGYLLSELQYMQRTYPGMEW